MANWGSILKGIGQAVGIGAGVYSAVRGRQDEKKANALEQRALDQAELEYGQRAPMRRQGMQALGQIEAPIELGSIGYNAANPFAAARGPAASTATLGDWGRFTTSPEQIDNALAGGTPQQINDALLATQARRHNNTWAYPAREREAAQRTLDRFTQQFGYTGMTPYEYVRSRGLQPFGRPPQSPPSSR